MFGLLLTHSIGRVLFSQSGILSYLGLFLLMTPNSFDPHFASVFRMLIVNYSAYYLILLTCVLSNTIIFCVFIITMSPVYQLQGV